MSDSHSIQVSVDASQAKRELVALGQSIGAVGTALKGLSSSSAGGGFDKLAQQVNQLSSGFDKLKSISSLSSISREINQISSAMGGLRAPNAAAITGINNLSNALHRLSGVRVGSQIGSDLSALSGSLNGFKVPAAATNNLTRLMNVLHNSKIDPHLAQGLTGLGSVLGNLKMPTSATITNLERLLKVLGSANANAVAASARAINELHSNTIDVKNPKQRPPAPPKPPASGGGGVWASIVAAMGGVKGHAAGLTGEMRGLENAFSASYQAASLFRTAVGAITLGELSSSILEAGNRLLNFKIGLDSVATSHGEVAEQLAFVRKMADETGGSLETLLPAYQKYAGATRSLGVSLDDTQKSFLGIQKAIAAMHVSAADAKRTMTEYMETFAMGGGHATQIMRGMGAHLPSMAGIIQDTLKINGAELKKKFKEGGLNEEEMIQIGKAFGEKYSSGVEEGLEHSQAAINQFKNRFETMKQTVFDSGFDSGLKTFMNTLTEALDAAGIDDIGKRMGEGFRDAFAAAGVLGKVLIENRQTILEVAGAVGVLVAALTVKNVLLGIAKTGWEMLAGAFNAAKIAISGVAMLFTPLGLALTATAVTVALLYANWESFLNLIGVSQSQVNAGISAIERFAESHLNLTKAIQGAVAIKTILNDLLSGMSWDDALGDARGKMESVAAKMGSSMQTQLTDSAKRAATGIQDFLGKALEKLGLQGTAVKGIMAQIHDELAKSKPIEWKSTADTAGNLEREQERAHEKAITMTDEMSKLYEKLNPSVKATEELAKNFKTIGEMLGKKKPGTNDLITQEEVDRMKEFARYNALDSIAPATAKIRDKMEDLKLHEQFAGKGNKEQYEVEKEILAERNSLKKKGLDLTKEEEDALRAILTLEKQSAKGGADGFSQWANSQKSATDALNDDIKKSMDSVADGISKIVTEGKGKFKSLGAAIRDELHSVLKGIAKSFINTGIKQLMAEGIKGLDLGNMKGALQQALGLGGKALDSAQSKIDAALKDSVKETATMTVTAGVVNINGMNAGGLGSAPGTGVASTNAAGETTGTSGITGSAPSDLGSTNTSSAFTTSGSGFNPSAVGGLETQANPASSTLPLFGSSAMTGGFGSGAGIPSNSASMFGELSGIVPQGASSALPQFGSSAMTSGLGVIGAGSALRFGEGLTTTAPQVVMSPAEQLAAAGIHPATSLPSAGFTLPQLSPSMVAPSVGDKPLGFLSAKYEGKIGTAGGDGGVAYGKYQFDSKQGGLDTFFKSNPEYAEKFAGLQPRTQAFNDKWREIAKTDPKGFEAAQDAAAKAKWYDPAAAHAEKLGFKMDDRGLQEGVFSGSIQHGGINKILDRTAAHKGFKDMSSQDQINAYYDERTKYADKALAGKPQHDGVMNRYVGERKDALGLSKQTNGVDGSIKKMTTDYTNQMNQANQKVSQQLTSKMDTAIKQPTDQLKNSLNQDFTSVLGSGGKGAQDMTKLGDAVKTMGDDATKATSSVSQLASKLGGLGGGLGGGGGGDMAGGAADMIGGMFSEGGYSNSPVSTASASSSFWSGAPHYSEGTPNTSGGMPAILHQNEAVIPLSRGRSIPVEMKGGDNGGGKTNITNLKVNLQAKDHDSFRRNAGQVSAEMQRALGRMAARNN